MLLERITFLVLKKQIRDSIDKKFDIKKIIIAYEPIWAIGTGKTPTIEEISDINIYIKKIISKINPSYNKTRILYGGSVNKRNAVDFLNNSNIDGLLVGGASLNFNSFYSILSYK